VEEEAELDDQRAHRQDARRGQTGKRFHRSPGSCARAQGGRERAGRRGQEEARGKAGARVGESRGRAGRRVGGGCREENRHEDREENRHEDREENRHEDREENRHEDREENRHEDREENRHEDREENRHEG